MTEANVSRTKRPSGDRWMFDYGDHVQIDLPGGLVLDMRGQDYRALAAAIVEQQHQRDTGGDGFMVRIEYPEERQ